MTEQSSPEEIATRRRKRVIALAEEIAGDLTLIIDWTKSKSRHHGQLGGLLVLPNDLSSQVHYLICLHEIGHLFHRHTRTTKTSGEIVLKQEAEAWDWALDNCDENVTLQSNDFIRQNLKIYARKRKSNIPTAIAARLGMG